MMHIKHIIQVTNEDDFIIKNMRKCKYIIVIKMKEDFNVLNWDSNKISECLFTFILIKINSDYHC